MKPKEKVRNIRKENLINVVVALRLGLLVSSIDFQQQKN